MSAETIEKVADAIDAARYQHPEHPRERPRPFCDADQGDREYARRLAKAAVAVQSWQPIETAPKDGTDILAFDPTGGVDDEPVYAVVRWYQHRSETFEEAGNGLYRKVIDDICAFWYGASYTPFRATHWQPLPEPPK